MDFGVRFDNVRIPRENLLNSVADVTPDGQYISTIKDPDQVILFYHMGNHVLFLLYVQAKYCIRQWQCLQSIYVQSVVLRVDRLSLLFRDLQHFLPL